MSRIDHSELIKSLSASQFVSGEELANRFGVSRTAIAKQIKLLQEHGVDIFSVHRSGYRLGKDIELLQSDILLPQLIQQDSAMLHVDSLIDSTNDYVKERVNGLPDGFVCLAQGQKKGRGRQGKTWVSPFGSNLYLSMKWHFEMGFQSLSGLSLAIGVATVRTIKPFVTLPVSLKWPNDVYIDAKKVSGTLVEVSGNSDGSCDAIIGIGLNVNMGESKEIDQPWTDLTRNSQKLINKNTLAATFINNLRQTVAQFSSEGLAPFVEEWEDHDHFRDKSIFIVNGKNQYQCIARGISPTGALLVDVAEGDKIVRKELFGGEISVKTA